MSKANYYIETYGCQMNEHDSEKMADMLEKMGMTAVGSANGADVVVINTCSIREKAEHKVYSALGKLKGLKKKNPSMITVVAGCVAQQEKTRLLKRVPHLDLVVGTHSVAQLPALIRRIRDNGRRFEATDFTADVESLHMPAPCKGHSTVCSFVTIMQGCSNFCSYCVVPYTRGPEQSRPVDEVIQEVSLMVDRGVQEITLLGQNVNAYGNDLANGESFSGLLRELDTIAGLQRIRFTTSHPRDFCDELADAMAKIESVCEHIHLPLQSGSDRILQVMGRGYTFSAYMSKITSLRNAIPNVAITTDMIVGFPGESDDNFRETLSALREIRYDQIFSFKFSPRPGTAAENIRDQIPEDNKAARLSQVHALQDEITGQYHKAAEGTEEEVLVEGIRERTGQPFGRTRTNKIVNLEADDSSSPGDLVTVRIVKGMKHSLMGKRIC
ncbi:tRNA (N6-isopentenyl adenosine(37)-C2)-methylthiotransferase MiaB [Thermodesulfobacteriota bacterium]